MIAAIEAHQRRALGDALAFLEQDRADAAGDLGPHVTDSSERRLPTAVIVCGIGCLPTLAASTATACCPPAAADLPAAVWGAASALPAAPGGPLRVPNQ